MEDLTTVFDNRQLSRIQAQIIADSQFDLGGKSKEDMVIALGGFAGSSSYEELLQGRLDAFNRLDRLTQLIILAFLEEQDLENAATTLNYNIKQIKAAIDVTRAYVEYQH